VWSWHDAQCAAHLACCSAARAAAQWDAAAIATAEHALSAERTTAAPTAERVAVEHPPTAERAAVEHPPKAERAAVEHPPTAERAAAERLTAACPLKVSSSSDATPAAERATAGAGGMAIVTERRRRSRIAPAKYQDFFSDPDSAERAPRERAQEGRTLADERTRCSPEHAALQQATGSSVTAPAPPAAQPCNPAVACAPAMPPVGGPVAHPPAKRRSVARTPSGARKKQVTEPVHDYLLKARELLSGTCTRLHLQRRARHAGMLTGMLPACLPATL
jgi:hypothetical protein